jgi:hypothetical protein
LMVFCRKTLRARPDTNSYLSTETIFAVHVERLRNPSERLSPQGVEPDLNHVVNATLKCVRENWSFAPQGLVCFPLFPTAYAVGCILTPLRG